MWWWATAFACEVSPTFTIVGHGDGGRLALLRSEQCATIGSGESGDLTIDLALVDLATNGTVASFDILHEGDGGDPKVRGARWAAAEAQLTAMGITVGPLSPVPLDAPATLFGRRVDHQGDHDENVRLQWIVVADGAPRLISRTGMTAFESNIAWPAAVAYGMPGGRYIAVVYGPNVSAYDARDGSVIAQADPPVNPIDLPSCRGARAQVVGSAHGGRYALVEVAAPAGVRTRLVDLAVDGPVREWVGAPPASELLATGVTLGAVGGAPAALEVERSPHGPWRVQVPGSGARWVGSERPPQVAAMPGERWLALIGDDPCGVDGVRGYRLP